MVDKMYRRIHFVKDYQAIYTALVEVNEAHSGSLRFSLNQLPWPT